MLVSNVFGGTLCIACIVSVCCTSDLKRDKLQLVGIVCLLIASKYEEIYPPSVKELVYITDNAYSKQ